MKPIIVSEIFANLLRDGVAGLNVVVTDGRVVVSAATSELMHRGLTSVVEQVAKEVEALSIEMRHEQRELANRLNTCNQSISDHEKALQHVHGVREKIMMEQKAIADKYGVPVCYSNTGESMGRKDHDDKIDAGGFHLGGFVKSERVEIPDEIFVACVQHSEAVDRATHEQIMRAMQPGGILYRYMKD